MEVLSTPFSLEKLIASFAQVGTETKQHQQITTIGFIRAYGELCKLFDVLGRGFSFVKNDLVDKLGILESIYLQDTHSFETLEKMVQWEVSNNRTIVYVDNNNTSGR